MTVDRPKRDYIIIVAGLPRSGTSLMMNAIGAGGIELLTDGVRRADEDNPKGYYEFEPVKKTKEDASWLDHATGKAVKMVYRLLYDLPADRKYRVIFTRRNLQEVLLSQSKMLERKGTPAKTAADAQMENHFIRELGKCGSWLARQTNFKVLYINHRDMINDGLAQAQKIRDFLDGGMDIDAMASVVDPDLYRNRT